MKNITRELLIITMLCFGTNLALSQKQIANKSDVTELKVGDQVPELVFTNIINSSQKTIKLSSLKGKLIILDFWATWCAPCISALPKLDTLQQQFENKLQIIPITYEAQKKVELFLSENQLVKNLKLPMVTGTKLLEYFPHKTIPHEIWIDEKGKVLAITGAEEVTKSNLVKYFENKSISLTTKGDILDIDERKPLLLGKLGTYRFEPEELQYSSIITKGIDGALSFNYSLPIIANNVATIFCSNSLIQNLYGSAIITTIFPSSEFYNPIDPNQDFYMLQSSRMLWEAKDSTYFVGTETKQRTNKLPASKLTFNYELRVPKLDSARAKQYMLQDLNRYFGGKFGFEGHREKRKVKCWALQVIGDEMIFISKGDKRNIGISPTKKGFKVSNATIDDVLFWWLSFSISPDFKIPIINETNYRKPIDIDLGAIDPRDFNAVNAGLKKYGLEFKLVERQLDMIVIKDVPKTQL